LVQEVLAKVAETAGAFPPMQPGATFNLYAVKEQIEKAVAAPGVSRQRCLENAVNDGGPFKRPTVTNVAKERCIG
jgi:hypothetical protein